MQPIKVESRNSDKRQNARQRDDWRVLGYAPSHELRVGRTGGRKSRTISRWTIVRQLSLSLVALVVAAGIVVSQNGSLSSTISSSMWQSLDGLAEQAGLGVGQISLSGHRYSSDIDLFAVLSAHSGRSLIGVDVKGATEELTKLAWVKSADIKRKFPDELVVHIEERRPYAVWQLGRQYWLVDKSGLKLAPIMKPRVGDLPRISGAGANSKFSKLMVRLNEFEAIRNRISSYAYVGNRRWRLTLIDSVIVELPADHERTALSVLGELMGNGRQWTPDIRSVDLRLADRVLIAKGRRVRASGDAAAVIETSSATALPLERGTLSAADLALSARDKSAPHSLPSLANRRGG